jgi:RNA polymerase sigma-70 factor, ECF subfamily
MGTSAAGDPGGSPESDFYLLYQTPLLRYVTSIVNGDRYTAEDVVQETMVRAWTHRDELVPELARPWLYTVARRLAISHHRRRNARPPEVPLDEATKSTIDDAFEDVVLRSDVAVGLRQLSPEQRRVVVELFFLQRSVGEVALALEIPPGTVKSRAFYGLRALRAHLETQRSE